MAANFRRKFGRFGGLAALGLALVTIVPPPAAMASQREGGLDRLTVEACLGGAVQPEELGRLGWAVVTAESLSEPMLDAFALARLWERIGEAPTTADRLAMDWGFARANARGDLRKLLPPGSPVSHTFFASASGSVLRVDVIHFAWGEDVSCNAVLTRDDMARTLEGGAATFVPESGTIFRSLPGYLVEDRHARRSSLLPLIQPDASRMAPDPDKTGVFSRHGALVSANLHRKPPTQ